MFERRSIIDWMESDNRLAVTFICGIAKYNLFHIIRLESMKSPYAERYVWWSGQLNSQRKLIFYKVEIYVAKFSYLRKIIV